MERCAGRLEVGWERANRSADSNSGVFKARTPLLPALADRGPCTVPGLKNSASDGRCRIDSKPCLVGPSQIYHGQELDIDERRHRIRIRSIPEAACATQFLHSGKNNLAILTRASQT